MIKWLKYKNRKLINFFPVGRKLIKKKPSDFFNWLLKINFRRYKVNFWDRKLIFN